MKVAQRFESLPTSRQQLLAVLTLALSILAVGLYWWRLDVSNQQLRQDALTQAERKSDELAGAVAAQTDAILRTVDFALRHLRDEYEENHNLDDNVRSVYNSFPSGAIAQIGIINAEGYLIWSSVSLNNRIYLGDREHFKVHVNSNEDRLFISHPVLGRATGAWSIQFSRSIHRQGKFSGVIVLSLTPQYLADSHKDMALSDNDVVSVFRTDGAYLSRTPELIEALGKSIPMDRPFLLPNASEHGVFRTESSFDKVPRIYAWRRLNNFPVIVNVGVTETTVLNALNQEIAYTHFRAVVGSVLVLSLSLGIFLLLLRAAQQQEALVASETRHRSFFEKNTSVKLVIDPDDGRIVDANPAAAAYYGYPRDQLLTMNIADINCHTPAEISAEMAKAKAEKRIYFNFRHRLASGRERDVEVYSGPVDIADKTLLFSIIHDVTDRHELEKRLATSEALHRNLIQAMAEGVIMTNERGEISSWNTAAMTILGVDAEGLLNHQTNIYTPEGARLALKDYPSKRAARGEYMDHALFSLQRPDGGIGWINVNSRPLDVGNEGPIRKSVISFAEITKLVEAEESLRLAQSVFEAASEGILVTDADTRIIAVNPAFSTLTGYQTDEVLGQKPSLLASGMHDAHFYEAMWQRLSRDGHWEGEISNRHKNGHIYVEWLRITVIPERLSHGRRYVALFSDITSRKRESDAVWHQANFDQLTGLPNRKLLEDRLTRAIALAHRKHSSVAVLFIDLDRFKPVNDQYGHATGDELLKQVARRLEHCLRDEDTVARLGGDEFVVVLPDLQMTEFPAKVADKILSLLSEPFHIGEHFIEISCSIGISLFPRDADNGTGLLARADAAMYAAKDDGRSTWHKH